MISRNETQISSYRLPLREERDRTPEADTDPMRVAALTSLQYHFTRLLESDAILRSLTRRLYTEGFQITVFGGWVRDRLAELIHGIPFPSKDIDFVINGNAWVCWL